MNILEIIAKDIFTDALEVEEFTVTEIEEGDISDTFLFETSNDDYIVQISEKNKDNLRTSTAAYMALEEEQEIPTPSLKDSRLIKDPYSITELLEGENLKHITPERATSRKLSYQAGEYLAEIHNRFPRDTSGYILPRPLLKPLRSKDWKDFVEERFFNTDVGDRFPETLISEAESYIEQNMSHVPENPETSVLHNDYDPSNLLSDGENITGVLDFGSAIIGDSDYDLVKAKVNFDRNQKYCAEELEKGYRNRREVGKDFRDKEEFYTVETSLRHLYALDFLDKNMRDITDRELREAEKYLEEVLYSSKALV